MSLGRVYGKFTGEFRETAVRRLRETDNVAALCRELGISRQLLYQWRDRAAAEATKPDPVLVTEQQLRQEILTACAQPGAAWPGASGSFRGIGRSFDGMKSEEPVVTGSPTHPDIDEPPVGYSLAGLVSTRARLRFTNRAPS